MAKIKRAPRLRLASEWGMGIGIHRERDRVMARVGAKINKEVEEADGRRGSFVKSFIASANGWRMP